MNEELRIIIMAEVDKALKNIKDVNDEIDKIKEKSDKSGKSLGESMKAVAKGATVAVGAVTALTTAMVAFGKSTLEVQRNFSKLETAFKSMGSSAEQAQKTYTGLYRYLGDTGKATEAASHLAMITTNEKELAQWTKITQGIYAKFGDSLPIEGLTEAANETIRVGQVTGTLADALNWAGSSEDAMNEKLASANSLQERELILRSTLNGLYMSAANIYEQNNQALLANAESQARLDMALAEAGRVMLPLMTTVNNLATTLLTTLKPALEVVAAVVSMFVSVIATAINWIGALFSIFSGGGAEKATNTTNNIKNNVGDISKSAKTATGGVGGLNKALGGAAKAAKELKKQTMGFDELNVMQSQDTASGGGGSGGGGGSVGVPDLSGIGNFEMPSLDSFLGDLDKAKEKAQAILVLVGAVALGFAVWKLATFLQDAENVTKFLNTLKGSLTTVGGVLMIVAGAVLLVQGYMDAWVNGIDWANFGAILGGIALIVGGVALAFGTVAAGAALLASGVALVVLGITDFVKNGYSMENVLTILAGVVAIVVGVCLAFNAALLANPITWIVIAIASLVAAFVILWNECEGFRNFWKAVWEKVKQLFASFVDSIQPLIDALIGAFNEAWELIKVIWNDYLVPLFKAAWEAIKAVWDFVKPYFAMLWENIKVIFSVVKDVLSSFFKLAWEAIKAIWDVVVGYFTAIWETIKGVFSVVKNVLSGNWKEAWEAIKGIVNTWKDYFSTVWNSIKNIFSAVKTYFKEIFSSAWSAVKAVFANWGEFFSGLWDKIKSTFSSLGSSIANAISNAVKSGINGVISLIENTINGAIGLINGAIGLINKIPGVSISKMSKLSLPRLARGGIVDSATIAMIGEQGKEAVVPLENNTEWMDKLASRLSANTPSKIVLMLDGKELGWASINSINKITKQTGTLQLAVR